MKLQMVRMLCVLGLVAGAAVAQEVIPLYSGKDAGARESYPEKQFYSKAWNGEVVSNVTRPTLTVFRPPAASRNGSGVVICPGGGFMALSISNEGTEVAKWLAAKGMTAFILKYRVAHTGEDATQEFADLYKDRQKFDEKIGSVIPLAIADGLAAVTYVRKHASEWAISPDRVGIVGFSAGGTVTTAVGFRYSPEGRPAFVAPIYPATSDLKDSTPPADAPPLFLAVASDDQFGLQTDSIALYSQWTKSQKSAELHVYAKGGHGFGMRAQGLPCDQWINQFAGWLEMQGLLKK
ncbi:MAG: alpha/beta hydrolase [Bryobacteraceae bacterium]|jgi:acetyl esterase/lipase